MDRLTTSTLESGSEQYIATPDGVRDPDTEIAEASTEPELLVTARLVWSRRAIVWKCMLWGLVIALGIGLVTPNTYEATVRLMPPDTSSVSGGSSSALLGLVLGTSNSSSGGSSGGIAGAVGDLLGTQKPGPLFIGILSSRTIADRLIDRFDLRKVYWTKTYMAARKKLSNHASFVEDKKSGLITITVDDRDRARATAMAGAYVEELDRLLSQVNDSASSREREFLEKRLASINVELDDASKKLSEFSSRNATLNPEDQAKAMLDSAALLEGQLIGAKSELSGLQQIYSDQNVRVRSLEAHIAELQQQLNAFGGKNYSGSTQLDANTLYPPIRQLPILGREYAVLYRRAKVDEAVFEFLTESYEIARVQEARDTPSVKVLDAARLPEKAAWPPRLLFALGGVGAGFLFSIGLILGGEYWASIDPREPYKAFWSRELLPSLRRRFASMGKRWRTPRSPFPGSSEPEDASRTDA